jgi:DNA replication and repair protein RecF
MRVDKIILENYRNYKKIEVDLDSDLVLIVGPNASGKTNFLESIYFLSRLKSFRAPDNLLVNHAEDFFAINARVAGHETEELEIVVQKNPILRRGFKINGQKTKRIAWNTFKTVLFVPNDLNMFTLGPDARRRFLNEVLVERESLYPLDLASLEHILKQRAALLEKIKDGFARPSELEFWNNELAQVAIRVSRARRNFLEYLNDKLKHTYFQLTGFATDLKVTYKGLVEGINEAGFVEILNNHMAAEINSGLNLIGPHRDDFMILKDELQNIYNSSRGELREQILAIKILQAEYITTGENKPIILLDDVFSELDEQRRNRLLDNLKNHQIILTTTERQNFSGANEALVIEVENGTIH